MGDQSETLQTLGIVSLIETCMPDKEKFQKSQRLRLIYFQNTLGARVHIRSPKLRNDDPVQFN